MTITDARERQKLNALVGRRILDQAVRAAELTASLTVNWSEKPLELLRALVFALGQQTWSEAVRKVLVRRGRPAKDHSDKSGHLDTLLDELDGPQIFGVLAELVAARFGINGWDSIGTAEEKRFYAALGIDRKKLGNEAKADLAGKKKGVKKALKGARV